MYNISIEVFQYIEDEFKVLAESFFDKKFNSVSLSEFRRKVTVLGIETGLTDEGRCLQVLVEPTTRIALLFVEDSNEYF